MATKDFVVFDGLDQVVLRAATLAPGSLRENNEQWSNKIAVTPPRERMPWTSDCKASMRS